MKPDTKLVSAGRKVGAPEDPAITEAMNRIFTHLESHDVCQYSFQELVQIGLRLLKE